jgi:hypothetical protein
MPAKWIRIPALALATSLAFAACSDEGGGGNGAADGGQEGADTAPSGDGEIAYMAVEYEFDGPDALPAGPVEIGFANDGQEPHELRMIGLEEGKTIEDVEAVLEQDPAAGPPKWVTEVGATSAKPGEEAKKPLEADLKAGNYVLLCFVQTEDGVPHAVMGMVKPVTVG